MAHEIDMTTGRPAMAYVGNTPWHGLGQSLAAGATIEEWQQAAGMDWRIKRSRIRFATSCNPEEIAMWEDMNVLFRSDTKAPLGVVSKRYQIVQPKAVLEFFRDLTEGAGFVLETAGCLFDGKRFWALARATADVAILDAKDKVGGFLLLSTSADGTLATTARFTTVRVVCNNTLSAAIGGKASYSLTHHAEFNAGTAKQAMGLVTADKVQGGFAEVMDGLRRLAATRVTPLDMADATMRLFGHQPSTMTEAQIAKAAKAKPLAAIGELAVTGDGLVGANLAGGHGTAWGWLSAVTQYVDHQARSKTQDLRLNSAWFGPGDTLKRKALSIAQEMADGSVTFVEREQTDEEFEGDILGAVLDATQGG